MDIRRRPCGSGGLGSGITPRPDRSRNRPNPRRIVPHGPNARRIVQNRAQSCRMVQNLARLFSAKSRPGRHLPFSRTKTRAFFAPAWVFTPSQRQTPRAKYTSSKQTPTHRQIPKHKHQRPNAALRALTFGLLGLWFLEFVWVLEPVCWNFAPARRYSVIKQPADQRADRALSTFTRDLPLFRAQTALLG